MTTPTTPAQPLREESLHSVLSARTRPSRPSALSASLTFGWRALLKIKHVPEQLFDVTAFPIMFNRLGTLDVGAAHRRVRAAHHVPVPQQEVTATRRRTPCVGRVRDCT
jgi:hypothetical protein